ncbi:MAG: hypothetical protein ACP5R4_14260, partial [Armatimonadota bacterium]
SIRPSCSLRSSRNFSAQPLDSRALAVIYSQTQGRCLWAVPSGGFRPMVRVFRSSFDLQA